MTRNALLGLIFVTSSLFSLVYAASQAYSFAVFAFGCGIVWLALEVRQDRRFSTVFFMVFMVLAIMRSIDQPPVMLILLGLSTNLAAWDLTRFQARIANETENKAVLETRHLQKLVVTLASGYLIALVPLFIQLSINFVVLLVLILLTMIALRQAAIFISA